MKRFIFLGLTGLMGLTAATAGAQWTNPNPTSAVSVAVMTDTNGNIQAPQQLTAQRFSAGQFSLSGDLISQWSDLSPLLGTPVTAVGNTGTAPSAPYAIVLLKKSGSSGLLQGFIVGQGGITATNDSAGVSYISGSVTDSVSALFPVQTGQTVRIYYRPAISPYNMAWVDFPVTTNGYMYCDGTNIFPASTIAGVASNAVLLSGQPGSFYQNAGNMTNFAAFQNETLVDAGVNGFDAGTNVVLSILTLTNNGIVYHVAKIDAGSGTASNTLWYSDNIWQGSNSFTRYIAVKGVNITGDGNTRSGLYSTVAGGTNNAASGNYSFVGGGYGNVASGVYATVPGGEEATASGNYSWASGHRVTAAGARSGVFGEYADNGSNDVLFIGWGQADTNHAISTLATNGLEVAGVIKAQQGFIFPDGSEQTTAATGGGGGGGGGTDIVTIVTANTTSTPATVIFAAGSSGATTGVVSGATTTVYTANSGGATGTPLYAETDPVWTAASTGYYTKVQSDSRYATGTPLYAWSETSTWQDVVSRGAVITGGTLVVNATITFTGGLLRAASPVGGSDVATKSYVDGQATAFVTNAIGADIFPAGTTNIGDTVIDLTDPAITNVTHSGGVVKPQFRPAATAASIGALTNDSQSQPWYGLLATPTTTLTRAMGPEVFVSLTNNQASLLTFDRTTWTTGTTVRLHLMISCGTNCTVSWGPSVVNYLTLVVPANTAAGGTSSLYSDGPLFATNSPVNLYQLP